MKKTRMSKVLFAVLAAILCVILIIDSEGTIAAARQSVTVCLGSIIPSLFALMVFSQLFIKSGIGDVLFYPLYKLNSFWFRGSRREFSVFMTSLFGGYPVGIRLLKDYIAYNKNYTAIAEKMLCYCYCGSPSFIIQVVGLSVLGSAKAGLLVYLSNVAACFTIAVIMNVTSPKKKKKLGVDSENAEINKITVNDLTNGIYDTVKALSIICGTILAFNIIIELFRFSGFLNTLEGLNGDKVFLAVTEISNISVYKGNNFAHLPLYAALTSFGGLCIIVQTAALSKGEIMLKKFILARIPTSFLSGVYMYLIIHIFPLSIETAAQNGFSFTLSAADSISSVCLIIMTYIVLKEFNTKSK